VLIEAYTLDDADGETHYVATVNREQIARDSLDELVDEIVAQSEHIAEHGEHDWTLGRHYAEYMLEYGIADEAAARKKIEEKIKKTVYTPLKQDNGQVDATEIDDDLEEYPDEIVEEKKQEFRLHGTSDGRVFRDGSRYILAR